MADSIGDKLKETTITSNNVVEENVDEEDEVDVVNPWNVVSKSQTGVDYDKLISKFNDQYNILYLTEVPY